MRTVPDRDIAAILREYSVEVASDSQLVEQVQSYVSTLLQWNRSISLTTITDPGEIVRFHFGESLFAASCVPIRGGRLADVGSGAGFPGLPLRMLVQALDLTLIESNAKKAAFLSEVVRRLALERVDIFRGRMQDFDDREERTSSRQFDFVTARALGQFDDLLAWSRDHLVATGKVVLWLGEEDVEALSGRVGWTWAAPVRIPGSERRFILTGQPQP
jgi:16S rRNA (guanine527-N7)-methyltransferase